MSGKPIAGLLFLLSVACTEHGRLQSQGDGMGEVRLSERELWQQCDRRIQPGSIAPNILLPKLFPYSKVDADSILRHQHIVLFWASWCGDCQAITDSVVQFQQAHPDIPWVTISLDSEAADARDYIRQHHLSGLHLFDGRDWRGDACTDYAVALHGIPYIIMVGEDGRIVPSPLSFPQSQ